MAGLKIFVSIMLVYSMRKHLLISLEQEKDMIKVAIEYSDFADVILSKLATELLDHIRINKHAIKFVKPQLSPYGQIYIALV